jgi:hypothetical protein
LLSPPGGGGDGTNSSRNLPAGRGLAHTPSAKQAMERQRSAPSSSPWQAGAGADARAGAGAGAAVAASASHLSKLHTARPRPFLGVDWASEQVRGCLNGAQQRVFQYGMGQAALYWNTV